MKIRKTKIKLGIEASKKHRRYTMTDAARIQRSNANRKPNAVHDWTTTKVSRQLMDWAKENYGSVNRMLAHYASRDKNRNH